MAAAHGRLDVLVANAGIWTCGLVEETTEEDFERLMGVNVKGTFFAIQNALRPMKAAGRGNIVVICSDQSLIGKAEQNLYGMTKGAIGQLVKSCGGQYAPQGIRVNGICAGTLLE